MNRTVRLHPALPPVCRLGLASRGINGLAKDHVLAAFERGLNYFNWAGEADGMRDAIRELAQTGRRDELVVAAQISATTAGDLAREIDATCAALQIDRLDVLTFYYIQSQAEWDRIRAPGAALDAARKLQAAGRVSVIGLTSHQRPLAAAIAAAGETELLMIRYNAAHRGAETDIFPTTDRAQIPVVAYTCLRWGALIHPLASDRNAPGPVYIPTAVDCYRFALSNPAVAIALTAPDTRADLDENLALLGDWRASTDEEQTRIRARGDKIKAEAGSFP
ncbi:MAG TPA: aldo/keto reductase [Planctomycetota bacterium]|nr:aldo/keto reductase [Planctomycetota bacterium]